MLLFTITSCTSIKWMAREHSVKYLQKGNISIYSYDTTDCGKFQKDMQIENYIKVQYLGWLGNTTDNCFQDVIDINGQKYNINQNLLLSSQELQDILLLEQLKDIKSILIVSKNKDEITWSRANKYFADRLQIITQTPYLIETKSKTEWNKILEVWEDVPGYWMSRLSMGEDVQFEINADDLFAKKCIYYMINGDEPKVPNIE